MSKPNGQTYQLRGFDDLLQLDADQLKRFARELPFFVLSAKFTNSLCDDITKHGESAVTLSTMTWRDDGVRQFTPHTVDGRRLFTLKAGKNKGVVAE